MAGVLRLTMMACSTCIELRDVMLDWLRSRRATTGRHGRPPAGVACSPFFPRSVGLRPTASCAKGALNMAPSMLCHRQAMPSIWSYSARPACQIASNTPASSHSRKRLCIALALPNRSLGSAFHWHPVRSTYTTASNTCRAGLGGRPAPGLRTYSLPLMRARTGINGSTRSQNSSVTTHESTRLRVAMRSSEHRAKCGSGRKCTIYG